MTKFRLIVPFRDCATGAVREVVITLSRSQTLGSMSEATRRGLPPLEGFRPVELTYAVEQACLALGGECFWSDVHEARILSYPPGMLPEWDRVRRAPELRVA